MRLRFCYKLLILVPCMYHTLLFAQDDITISGYVRDRDSGENLYWASVYDGNSGKGTVSNAYGFFSFTAPKGNVNLVISYVGYQKLQREFASVRDTTINANLEGNNTLEEIVISESLFSLTKTFQGHEQISMESIKKLPGFLGEQDVLKSLAVLPGIQQGHEGSAGIFVRGGSPDQNLILLDDVPVYNASHLFGFVSVFTPEAIQSVDLYKGGFPARYGGRLSSVIDVRMKEGNKYKPQTELTIGLISSKFTHEGPIKEGKSSYIISFRRTLLDLLVTGAAKINQASSNEAIVPGLNFYDVNAKLNFDLNVKNRLYVSFYTGGDHLFSRFTNRYSVTEGKLEQKTGVDLTWGNSIGAIRWNSQLGNKLFMNATLSSGLFQYGIHNNYEQLFEDGGSEETTSSDIKYQTLVNNNKLKLLFDWYLHNNNKIQFGASGVVNWYVPGKQEIIKGTGARLSKGNRRTSSREFSLFIDDHFSLKDILSVYLGLRLDLYETNGKRFSYLLPRASLKYSPTSQYSLNISYAEMSQPIHLLTNSSIGLPSDIWVPATRDTRPEFSRQLSMGINVELFEGLNYTLDSYYKTMDGVINYKAGYSFMDISEDWETLVETGNGKSWGFENSISYEKEEIEMWFNYTLAWNKRKFSNINGGEYFPFKFDRRHDINLGFTYQISKQTEFSAMWIFQTGQAATIPQQDYLAAGAISYMIDDFITGMEIEDPDRIQYVDSYNNYRLPTFHHLDVSFTFKKQRAKSLREWKVGVYNVYARQNPYMYYSHTNPDGYREYKQICLFPFLPSVSYHVKF